MKKTTALALLGGATVAAGVLGVVRESNRHLTELNDRTTGTVTDALRKANATTDDEIVSCVRAYIRSETEHIDVHPAYYPVLKFGPATALWRTRRPLCDAEMATLRLLREVFEALTRNDRTLSDRAARRIVLGTLDIVQEYEDAQRERNTVYEDMIQTRLEPVFDAVESVLDQLDRLKQRANGLMEPVIRHLRKA